MQEQRQQQVRHLFYSDTILAISKVCPFKQTNKQNTVQSSPVQYTHNNNNNNNLLSLRRQEWFFTGGKGSKDGVISWQWRFVTIIRDNNRLLIIISTPWASASSGKDFAKHLLCCRCCVYDNTNKARNKLLLSREWVSEWVSMKLRFIQRKDDLCTWVMYCIGTQHNDRTVLYCSNNNFFGFQAVNSGFRVEGHPKKGQTS